MRLRFWIEVGLAAASALLLVVTLITREWIELVFGVDPDNGSGSLEWLIVALTAATTIAFAVAARLEWRHARAA
jgi:hypothetical protein